MARPKSEDKRNMILAAAAQVFASQGLSASTASITSAAGVAEGTLFTYFKGKDDLINTLYESIKLDLAGAMMSGYPRKASIRARTQHIWIKYVDWGVENPEKMAALRKIAVWEGLDAKVRAATTAAFSDMHSLTESAVDPHVYKGIPQAFFMAMLSAQAETTMQFMKQDPKKAKLYAEKGFEIFWNGISRKK